MFADCHCVAYEGRLEEAPTARRPENLPPPPDPSSIVIGRGKGVVGGVVLRLCRLFSLPPPLADRGIGRKALPCG